MNFIKKNFLPQSNDSLYRQIEARRLITVELQKAIQVLIKENIENVDEPIIEGPNVDKFCSCLESIFIHCLKKRFSTRNENIPKPEFWSLILAFTHKDVVDSIEHLSNIDTLPGRCRAWIRIAINEGLLISYLSSMLSEKNKLNSFYIAHSYILDSEQPQLAITLLEGLSLFKFRINFNLSILNAWNLETLSLAGVWVGSSVLEPTMPAMDVFEYFKYESKPKKIKNKNSKKQVEHHSKEDTKEMMKSSLVSDELFETISSNPTSDGLNESLKDETISIDTQLDLVFEPTDPKFVKDEEIAKSDILLQLKDDSLSSSLGDLDVGFDSGFPDSDQCCGNRLTPECGCSVMYDSDNHKEKIEDLSFDSLLQSYNKDSEICERTVASTPDFVEIIGTSSSPTEENKSERVSPSLSMDVDEYEVISSSYAISLQTDDETTKGNLNSLRFISTEKGLDTQQYKCKGCNVSIGMIYGPTRQCHFSGYHYCLKCHENDEAIIPAKVIYNWDFKKYPVSKHSKSFLGIVENEPLLDMKVLNSLIYSYVPEMKQIQQLRTQLGFLRSYLFTCRESVAEDLRKKIWPREHLYEHIHLFSCTDLFQLPSGFLQQLLQNIISFCQKHIESCNLCSLKGFICEVCCNSQVIYPFQIESTYRCDKCLAVYHKDCMDASKTCPKCERKNNRKLKDNAYTEIMN